MKNLLPILVSLALAPTALADGLQPGSALVYPVQYTGILLGAPGAPALTGFSILCVTNRNLDPITPTGLGGSTNVHFEYVNVIEQNGVVDHCQLVDRVEFLTPADTLCVLAACHNAAPFGGGYAVVSAQDPNAFDVDWSFDHLMGSEVVIDIFGGIFTLNAIPFDSPVAEGAPTDLDLDGQLDFDGLEYEGVPDELYIDSFMGVLNSSLILINLSGGPKHKATVAFDIWNDNEFPLSATTSFECWMQRCLAEDVSSGGSGAPTTAPTVISFDCISQVFSQFFLETNTPHSPTELDLTCAGSSSVETGWARIRGLQASSAAESIPDPALLGAIIGGVYRDGGRRLWESEAKQFNGNFLETGVVAGN